MFKKKSADAQQPGRRPNLTAGRQQVFSYYTRRERPDVPSGRGESLPAATAQAALRLKRWQVIGVALCCGVLVVFCMSLNTHPRVTVTASNGLSRNYAVYEYAAAVAARASLLNYSKLTIDTNAIEAKLQEQFPEIERVEVTVPLIGRRPNVELITTRPLFMLINQSGSFYVASDGRASAEQSVYTTRPKDVVQLYDQSGLSFTPGKQALPKASVNFINQVISYTQAKKVKIDSLTLPQAPTELHMRVAGETYYIKFNLLDDARQQVGAYAAVQASLDKKNEKPLEYIDVRVSDRAFYK